MKHLLVLTMLLVSHLSALSARLPAEGYYITNNNDTVYATFSVFAENNGGGDQQGTAVKCVDNLGKKIKLNPKDVKRYCFKLEGKFYTYEAVRMSWQQFIQPMIFLFVETDGYCKLFKYTYYDKNNYGKRVSPVFRRGDGDSFLVVKILNMIQRESLEGYFSDCSKVTSFMESSAHGKSDYAEMARLYNEHCAQH